MNHLERRFNREIILKHFQKCMSACVTTIFICILKQETFYANFKNQSKTQKVNYQSKKKITVDFLIDTCICNMVMFFSLEFSTFFTHIRVHIVVLFTQNLHFKNVQLCSRRIFPFFFTTCYQNYSLMYRQRHQQTRTCK